MSKKTTKRALAMSFVSVFLCVCMLVGTTFAWFTDSVSSGNNKIVAGTLEVDLLMADENGNYASIAGKDAAIFGEGSLAQDNAQETLWEPGKTQIVYLAVENNGNLDLKYNIALNVVDGGLIGSLEYAIVDGAQYGALDTYTDWETLKANAQTGDVVAGTTVAAPNGAITVAEKIEYFALAVHMKEDAGNKYMGKDITIDVTVLATQLTSESDSFDNQYDVNAPFSVWDGVVPAEMPDTLVVDGTTQTIHVKDAAAFAYLSTLYANWTALFTDGNGNEAGNYVNGAGADYYYGHRWTISLEADIDLNNATIDPVTIKHPVNTGAPSFEGNNHTIKNAKIVTDAATANEAGLFNGSAHVAFKNLKLDNIHVTGSNVGNSTAGILSGSCNADQGVQNITITNSSVTGGKYTGGVVGYGYTDVLNCTLTNVTVKGGYKLGGLIGYICASSGTGDVTGNTLTDCTVDGIGGGVYAGGKTEYVIGKLVGNYNCNGTCNNNTVTGMTSSVTENIGQIEAGKTVTE